MQKRTRMSGTPAVPVQLSGSDMRGETRREECTKIYAFHGISIWVSFAENSRLRVDFLKKAKKAT